MPTLYWWYRPTLNQTGELNAPYWLRHSQRQLVIKHLALGLAEIAVLDAPIGNRAANPVDELAHGGLPFRRALLAVKIFRNHDFGGQHRPGLGHLDVLLLEDDLAGIVGDLGGAPFPFHLVKGIYTRRTENPFQIQGFGPGTAIALAAVFGG